MIQTKTEIHYNLRGGKIGKIRIELSNPVVDDAGNTTYTVTDWKIDEAGNRSFVESKPIPKTAAEIDFLDNYIEQNYPEVLQLPKTQRERKKMQIGLMLDTKTNLLPSGKTIYELTANDWEFTPDPVIE
ncbi:hypothetical protein [Flavobacterium sp. UMI-01]|uniref:hypothetical protein n=1 Tax=Flavobacterium sp. UMI-01 TaxID=1441053 RepID=UPI001C7CF782|nr:hypothetical protein [Flavobacterium sp. UMI-01]GIZ08386.1 hypothetical protein FUMI01_11130 [Flavobacterium sp. UMI-01]